MLPVLFSIGPLAISSFGFFLAVGFVLGTFLIWRLARAWDLDEEKILDLTLLTFFGGLMGSRIYFVIEHLDFFADNLASIVLITKYPGFSFWGAFLGGWLTLFIFSKRLKLDFWQIADIAIVGFLGGLIMGDIGCLLGGCGAGRVSDFLGINVVGLVGKRFPVQALEALIFIFLLFKVWPKAVHFHTAGKIVSLSLIYIGFIKFIMEGLRDSRGEGYLLSGVLVILGLTIFYKITGKNPISDIKSLTKLSVMVVTEKSTRRLIILNWSKSWYNLKVSWKWRLRQFGKLSRRFHVNTHPKNP